ncbi:phosphatidylglycerol lysyltransferase domain-containing protein [Streptantibioticus silvisoli]|uniref:Phosphatidylglycerol lysyltransferase domain-containing protein n=1 Tax=Streptantibioticus silvisoli TaxID=2705255 RepID=A0ABT6VW42_9ACTN|nr:phosphatidylglycerol lysyltransferase domain-containing protein [Streptantibioticus silvisoli]MDI5961491.1 phosphatidylglycerol lysyltransferase domain-containing protein [Streptantibioticus silvisoli]
MWDWLTDGYHTRIVESGRQPLFLLLVGLLGSFLFIRFSVRMIRRGTSWWPGNVSSSGGLHIHHVVFGQAMMLIGGIGAFALRGDSSAGRDLLGLLFGIGCGLVLDEFALVLHLKDVYWSEEGRQSVDAVILAVAVIGLLLLGITPLGNLSGGSVLSRAVTAAVLLALVVVSLLKGKVWTGFFGLFLVFLPLIGAVRLARPNSPWARWRYYSRPRRLARAERREARIRGRLRITRSAVYNAVAGAPYLDSPVPRGRPAPAKGPRRPSTAGLGPSRADRLLRPLREPAAVAVVWYLRLAALADVAAGLVEPFRARLRGGGTQEVLTPFLVTAGFTAAAVAALLAVMVRRRKRAAWLVAFALAAVNAAVYWLTLLTAPGYRPQPVNWLSAALTTLVAVALWVAGPLCRVRGEHGNVPLGLAWLLFGGVVAVGLGTVLVHEADTVPTAPWPDCLRYALLRVLTLSTLVGLPDIAVPGWVDLIVNVLSVALLLQVLRAFFRSPRGLTRLSPDDEHQLRSLLREFGRQDSLGYFALRRDTSVAWAPDRAAAVLFRVVNGVALACGDPVGDPAAWPRAISGWLRTARAHAWVPAVTCAGPHAAGVYERLGLRTLAFGDEAVVRTAGFRLEGDAMRPVREARDALRGAGYRAVVRRQRDIPRAEADRLARLADAWRRGAVDRGPAVSLARLGDRDDPRCVLVECRDPNDRTCALLSLVPWDGTGLSLDLVRRDTGSPGGMYGYLLAELLLRARADAAPVAGVERVALGVAVRHSAPYGGHGPGTGWVFRLHRTLSRLPAHRRRAVATDRATSAFAPGWQPRFLLYERATELPRITLANAGSGGLLTTARMPRLSQGEGEAGVGAGTG